MGIRKCYGITIKIKDKTKIFYLCSSSSSARSRAVSRTVYKILRDMNYVPKKFSIIVKIDEKTTTEYDRIKYRKELGGHIENMGGLSK